MGIFGMTERVENDFAQKFEEKRSAYQRKLNRLFEIVQEENKTVNELVYEANEELSVYRSAKRINTLDNQSLKDQGFFGIQQMIPVAQQSYFHTFANKNNNMIKRLESRMFSKDGDELDLPTSNRNITRGQNL